MIKKIKHLVLSFFRKKTNNQTQCKSNVIPVVDSKTQDLTIRLEMHHAKFVYSGNDQCITEFHQFDALASTKVSVWLITDSIEHCLSIEGDLVVWCRFNTPDGVVNRSPHIATITVSKDFFKREDILHHLLCMDKALFERYGVCFGLYFIRDLVLRINKESEISDNVKIATA